MNTAIVLASGIGQRFGAEIPKQFLILGELPVFLHSIMTFERHEQIGAIVLVAHPEWIERCRKWTRGLAKLHAIVPGGATRMDSGETGLRAAPGESDVVLVHDAARPFVSARTITSLLRAACETGAAIPVLPCPDTLVHVEEADRAGAVADRATLRRVQTPQAFRAALLIKAYTAARNRQVLNPTDDAQLVRAIGAEVQCVQGDEAAFKITTPTDLALAEAWLATMKPPEPSQA